MTALGMIQLLKSQLRPWKKLAIDLSDRLKWAGRHGQLHSNQDLAVHLRACADWLVRAQDAGTDRGVSYGATLDGDFQASYPETTGYIIPTFLDLARYYQDPSYRDRAIEMGRWEIAIQMSCGAVMGGPVNSNPTPALFNTGMVLLGWSALYRETQELRFLEAADRAGRWMLEMQDPDGNWRRGNSEFANSNATLYNVKAAWGLCEAGKLGLGEEAIRAAVRNADYCLTRQKSNGWFAECDLEDPTQPLLHTIAYTMQGLIGIGRLTNRPDYFRAAETTARSLIRLMSPDGFLPGRIDDRFQGTVRWCCLTGTAQTSIVWSELFELTGDEAFREARQRANRYLMARHDVTNLNPAIRGAVFGSWPVWGDYGRLMVLNWATKFFVDAILLEIQQDRPV
ncbi:MAG: hypothetical protein ACLQU5_07760 [Isosphaeraceae bacterium]